MRVPPLLAAFALLVAACKAGPAEPDDGRRGPTLAPSAPASSAPPDLPPPRAAGPFVAAMNEFCVITQQVNADAKVKKSDRPTEIVKRLLAAAPPAEFLELLRSLGDLDSSARYATLQKAAATRGAPNWSCPALAQ